MPSQLTTNGPRERLDIIDLVQMHCAIDSNGYGQVMEIYAPGYSEDLPSSNNGYGAFKHNSTLAKKYFIRKFRANGEVEVVAFGRHIPEHAADLSSFPKSYGRSGNTLIAWQVYGFAPEQTRQKKSIPQQVHDHFRGSSCVFTSSSNDIEIDHKHGRDQACHPKGVDLRNPEHYQPTTKHINNIKRQHCAECKYHNLRFDAQKLGFPVGWTEGGPKFEPTRAGCRGCFWFDPIAFRTSAYDPRSKR